MRGCFSKDSKIEAWSLACALTLLASAVAPLRAVAQSPQPVSIYVTVTQKDKLIGGLTQSNFRIYEDGKAVEFKLEAPEKPVSVALLVEYSRGSATYFNDIEASIRGFMNVAPEGNWYGLATFSQKLEINVDFTKLHGKIAEAFVSLGQPMSREINTYDAVYDMLEAMRRHAGRGALIVIGSGLNSFSAHTLDDVRKQVQSSNITVFGVGTGSAFRGQYSAYLSSHHRTTLLQAENFLRMLANESGGEAWFPKFEQAFPGVIAGIMQVLDFQYRLVYTPHAQGNGKFHKIKVEAFHIVNDKRQNFKALARAGLQF